MRVLGPIVQVSALSVLDAWEQLTPSDTIAPQFVSHDHPRDVLQPLHKPSEEVLRGVGIAPGSNEDVEHNAILIGGAPEVALHALNPWIASNSSLHIDTLSRFSIAISPERHLVTSVSDRATTVARNRHGGAIWRWAAGTAWAGRGTRRVTG